MKKVELWEKINDGDAELLFNLWGRWQDEHEYEDINDYLEAIQKHIPQAYAITKRPFGIKCKADDGNLYITAKIKGKYLQLFVQNI